MHSDLVTFFDNSKRNSVIEVFGVSRIDSKREHIAHIAPSQYFGFFYHSGNSSKQNHKIGCKITKNLAHIQKKL